MYKHKNKEYLFKYYLYRYNLSSGLIGKEKIFTNTKHLEDYIFVERQQFIMFRTKRFGKKYFKQAIEEYLSTQKEIKR